MPDLSPATDLRFGATGRIALVIGMGASMTIVAATGQDATALIERVEPLKPPVRFAGEVDADFARLAAKWREERRACRSSSLLVLVTLPSYQRIIGLGIAAVPHLLADLASTKDTWGWALQSITGEDPVPADARGNGRKIADAWLAWGRARGLVT